MDVRQRYDVISQIGQGDFAIVYKARDRELGREVAIKQIHQQYLADPQQLEKYWQEAQLLAALEHPNVMTIYDLVRPLGWLVLELMQGSLRDRTAGQPMNLDYLRVTLFHCLHALKFLHSHGIIHGDIKPGNMMLDRRNRVKIGDFGLARRAANADGSLLKGTTKYMAPEVLVDHFGPVTPASDLYSLGFSAYELLCGQHFENLFPGLNAFGRDKQLAWVMWHSAADRRLPEISKVMEGVPPDLAHVIQKLCEKDPKQRYQGADQALADLTAEAQPQAPLAVPVDADEEKKTSKRKRIMLVGALVLSMALSVGMFFIGSSQNKPPPKFVPVSGEVRHVVIDERRLVVDVGENVKPKELAVRADDEIRLNDKFVMLSDLKAGDLVTINMQVRDGRTVYIITAARAETNVGRIRNFQPDENHFTMAIEEGPARGESLHLYVNKDSKVSLNGSPVTFKDLREGDSIEVDHVLKNDLRTVTRLASTRSVAVEEGIVRDIDIEKKELTLSLEGEAQLVVIPYKPDCEVTINKLRFLGGALIKPDALLPGDKVLKIVRDTHVQRIDVYRTFTISGTLRTVRVEEGTPAVDVSTGDSTGEFLTFRVGSNCPVTLGGQPVQLSDLHARDTVTITHDSPDQKNLDALSISATRPKDLSRWALIVSLQNYDDNMVPPPPSADRDAQRFLETAVRRYGLEPDQAMLLTSPSRIRLEQDVPEFLKRAESAGQLLVYFVGHAFVEEGIVYLAPKDFSLGRVETSGLPLKWLVDQIEKSPANEKILLLDVCQKVDASLEPKQPSTAAMIELYKAGVAPPALKTVTVIASCNQDQRPLVRENEPGVFVEALTEALAGKGDKNRDNRLTSAELFEYANLRMGSVSVPSGGKQTPALFLPNVDVPRLTSEAKSALSAMLALLARDKPDAAEADALLRTAEALCGREPEPKLLHGLILLKAKEYNLALSSLETVKIAHPTAIDAHAGMVWSHFSRPVGSAALIALAELIEAAPRPKKVGQGYDDDTLAIIRWAGGLREFAAGQLERPENDPSSGKREIDKKLDRVDAAAASHGKAVQDAFAAGREEVRKKLDVFNDRIKSAQSDGERAQLQRDRTRLSNYSTFNFEDAAKRIQDGLEK